MHPAVAAVVLPLSVAGLALRVWGIQHGLPHPTTRPDEREVLDHTAQFATGDLNPRWFIYPPFYFHLDVALGRGAARGVAPLAAAPGLLELLKTNLAPLLRDGRGSTALLGALTVPVAWAIGRRMGGTTLGLVASTLVATCSLLVRDAHALKPDVRARPRRPREPLAPGPLRRGADACAGVVWPGSRSASRRPSSTTRSSCCSWRASPT